MLAILRSLRHGYFSFLDSQWVFLGNFARKILRFFPIPVSQEIGHFGTFKMHTDFAFSNFKNWGGNHNDLFDKCIDDSKGKSCVFDIGAHIGIVTMPLSKSISANGIVVAFEPAKANRAYLKYHIKKNSIKNVRICDKLVGSSVQKNRIFYEMMRDTGMNSIRARDLDKGYIKSEIDQITIDSYCEENDIFPDIMKIDVEGAEIDVLLGAKKTIQKVSPRIYLSVHPTDIKALGQSLDELVSLIDELNYNIYDSNGKRPSSFKLKEYLLTPKK